ncbi:penicillin acylase family protein [Occallatibacter savannae]|uniref:penicillin acylase family protein n=1 Tax=Occallatibacter savannae TaxID=1002691 RepID=UPI000D692A3E|nr:penicillin acylase family protein [Occallatibacter savannae]
MPPPADREQVLEPTDRRSARRRWPRIVLIGGFWFLTTLVLLVAIFVVWLRSAAKAALPQLDGEIHLAAQGIQGPAAPVIVQRDQHGVPHISAASQEDMFVAQGYITAQDRLWQMDAYRRTANGELAELMGPSLVRHDKMQRVLQFRNVAHRIYGNLPPDERARLDAYARGVNIYIAQHQDSLPPEFRMLHYKPQPWSGVDSISIGMMMVDMLDTHWYTKLARGRISAQLNNPKLESDLYPVGSWRDHPPTGELINSAEPHPQPAASADDDDERTIADLTNSSDVPAHGWESNIADVRKLSSLLDHGRCPDCTPGSNNWVISGAHTASGKPLLSNDMHLGLNEPNIWYMADLRAPGFHAAGVTLPGMPFVIAGHNEHVAWGFTALYADVQDLYIENVQTDKYEGADAQWHPLTIDRELIRVRGARDVHYDVRLTDHGPLIDPIFTKDPRPIALKWNLYDPSLNSIPLYAINTASNWTDFSAALKQWSWPSQNVVYSDDQGHIGYHAIGRLPIRPADISSVPIGDAKHEWQGYMPFDDLPNAFDPPSGFLATANSRVTSVKSKYPLTNEWADPYRAERIYKLLQGRDHLTPADMLAVQTDIYSEADQQLAHRLATAIDHSSEADARLRQAADLLRNWDGRLTTDSVAASIEVNTRYALRPMLLEPKLGKDLSKLYQWSESNFAFEEIVMHASPDWLPPDYKDWDALLTYALRRVLKDNNVPSDLGKWTYGSWHVVDIEHPLAGFLPFIGRTAGTGRQPLSGDTITVKQVGESFGPSQRFTMDWSNIDGSTENIVLGESGNVYSPYYRDQWSDYYNGRTFALPFTPAAVTADTQHTLRLLP